MAEFSKFWECTDFNVNGGLPPFLAVGQTMTISMTIQGETIPKNAKIIGGMFLVRIIHTGNIVPTSKYCYLGIQEKQEAFVGTYGDTSTIAASVGYSPWTSLKDLGAAITFGAEFDNIASFPVSNLEIFKEVGNFTLQFFQPESSSGVFANSVSLLIIYTVDDSNTIGYYSDGAWNHYIPMAYYNNAWVECDPYVYQDGAWVLCSSS